MHTENPQKNQSIAALHSNISNVCYLSWMQLSSLKTMSTNTFSEQFLIPKHQIMYYFAPNPGPAKLLDMSTAIKMVLLGTFLF